MESWTILLIVNAVLISFVIIVLMRIAKEKRRIRERRFFSYSPRARSKSRPGDELIDSGSGSDSGSGPNSDHNAGYNSDFVSKEGR